MNQVVKFDNTRKRRLNWEQEGELKLSKRKHRFLRDQKKCRHSGFEEIEE